MSDDSDNESISEYEEPAQILYDILPYKEWEQEPEVIKYPDKGGQKSKLSYWPFSGQASSALPGAVENILSHRLPWLFAVSQDANLVAILQESTLEVWHSKENYGTLVGRRMIRRDPTPSWRSLAWNEDSQLLAIAYSDGNIEICDTVGGMMYQIISPNIPGSQPGGSSSDTPRRGPTNLTYVHIFFTNVRIRDKKWISELVVVDVGGRVISFLVSSSGYQELSNFSVGWNLTSAVYSHHHNLLITSGVSPLIGRSAFAGKAGYVGIHSYRLTNESPYFVSTLDADDQAALSSRGFTFPFISNNITDYVVSMASDESGRRLGAIHESGCISVWLLPGLVRESQVNLTEQPAFDEVNPQLLQVPGKKKMKQEFLANEYKFHPACISWWNQDSVIISRISGALSVLKLNNLSNLLGDAPEFLDGVPRLSQTFEKGFFALECESVIKGRRQSTKSESAGEDPDVDLEVEESDDEESSWVQLGKRSAAAIAYFMTDNERFAPPKKKSKIVRRTYRMIGLISTTPEELYARKIENEEYGEAIMLAQHYRLDTDPVYERQWKKSNKSVAAIHDYLGKIKRRICVLKECLETIPEDIDATRELLEYGLSGTDLETLIAMGVKDSGEFIRSDRNEHFDDEWFEDNTSPDRQREIRAEREKTKLLKLISKVNWQSLSLVQKDLIASRLKFLYYLDILEIYEDAMGGGQFAADKYEAAVYRTMRSLSPLENCLSAARSMDAITISAFFSSIYSEVILAHWLPILSAFPETTKPDVLVEILPSINMEGQPVPWLAAQPRSKDWSEQALSMKWSGHKLDWDASILYTEDPDITRFKDTVLTTRMITEWYEWRARTVTKNTSIPELALELLQKGIERNVEVDLKLINDLRTLDALVYDVQIDLDLEKFQQMSEAEQMTSLLSRTTDLLQDIRSLLLPFLLRMDDAEPGQFIHLLYTFCVEKAEQDLTIPLTIIENSRLSSRDRILENVSPVVQLGIDCSYAHGSGKQIDYLDKIAYCLRDIFESSRGGLRMDVIQSNNLDVNQFRTFMQHIDIAKILHRNSVNKPLSILRDGSKDLGLMKKIFDQINCNAEKIRPPLDQDGWRCVLKDLQRLQKLIPIVPLDSVFYAFSESLLASGYRENIELAGEVLKTLMEEADQVKVVLTAWKHYFSSSTNLQDPSINLAKQCLRLINFNNKEISECFDLISSLQSLSDFGLPDLHPFSVLNSKNRVEFVTLALNSKPNAYRNSQRLMKLASLLRVEENLDSMEGVVWVLVARKALEAADYTSCYSACENLMKNVYTQGWDICFALGVQEGFTDLAKCQDLLSFAVSHCDPENIENIILSQLKVEQKMLHEDLANKANDPQSITNVTNEVVNDSVFEHDEGIEEDKYEDTVEDLPTTTTTREVSPFPTPGLRHLSPFPPGLRDLSPFPVSVSDMKNRLMSVASIPDMKTRIMTVTSMSSQYLLDNQISKSVLDRTSSWIQQIALKESQDSFHVEESNKKQDKLLIPAFYASLFTEQDDIEDNRIDLNYKKLSPAQQELDLLRAAQQGLRSHVISSVLHCLVNNKLENTGTANNIAHRNSDVNQNGVTVDTAVDINENMETSVKEEEVIDGKIPKELLQELISSLANQDFFQGLGVLLTLLETDNLEDFLISLPQTKHTINLILVFISFLIHIENTEEDSEIFDKLSPKDVVLSALKDGKHSDLYKTLNKFLEIAADHNQAGVLSSLTGDIDVSRFSRDQQYKEDTILGLARSLEDSSWQFTCTLADRYNVDPWIVTATHMEAVLVETEDAHTITDMIKKQDLVSALEQDGARWREWSNQKIYPLLDGSNLKKLQLYYETMHEITQDQLYAEHSSVVTILIDNDITIDYLSLLSGDRKVLKSVTIDNIEPVAEALGCIPENEVARLVSADAYLFLANLEFNRRGKEKANWVDACTKCQDILEKLDAASLKLFCVDAILSEESITNISRSARIKIIKKLITLVEIKIAIKAPDDWASMLTWQQDLKNHVESFQSQLTKTILEVFPAKSTQLIVELEKAGKSTQNILEFFVDVLGNHTASDVVSKLIVIWKQHESKIDEAFKQIFNHCVDSLMGADEIKPDNLMPQCLQYLIEELQVRTENARNQLMPLCTLEKMPVAHRLMFVQLVKKTGSSESETKQGDEKDDMFDSSFLAEMYEVEARLQELMPGLRITDQDLVNDEAKAALIQRISKDIQDLAVMTKLSEFSSEFLSSNPTLNKACLNQLIDYGLQLKQSKDDITNFIVKISSSLEKNDIERVMNKCLDIDQEIYVKLVCERKIENKFTEIAQIIQNLETVEDTTLSSVIHAGLGADLASTQLYVRMMEVAISEEIADKLVEQLKEGGYRAQACSLQLIALRIPGALRTMAAFKL